VHAPNFTLPAPHARLFSVWDKLALMSACVWVQVFLFSVFDGHAGSRAAEEAGAQLHGLVEARLLAAEQPSGGAGDEVASALESAIGELDARLLARGEAAGSTAGVRAQVQPPSPRRLPARTGRTRGPQDAPPAHSGETTNGRVRGGSCRGAAPGTHREGRRARGGRGRAVDADARQCGRLACLDGWGARRRAAGDARANAPPPPDPPGGARRAAPRRATPCLASAQAALLAGRDAARR